MQNLVQLYQGPLVACLLLITILCSRLAWLKYQENEKILNEKIYEEKSNLDFLIIGAAECGTENLNKMLKGKREHILISKISNRKISVRIFQCQVPMPEHRS